MHRAARPLATAAAIACLASLAVAGQEPGIPKPTFAVSFDRTAKPEVVTGRRDHPAAEGVRYVPGRTGEAALLGDGPIVVYNAHGNIPDEATLSLWIQPLDWKPLDAWRDLVVLRGQGRHMMMFSHYPKAKPSVRFTWSPEGGSGHEATTAELRMNAWNHVAIAWDGFRSRVYLNGRLALSKPHPAGFRPALPERASLHLGGIAKGYGGYFRGPWGQADTAYDDLVVFPGALSPVQVAALAGQAKAAREFGAPPEEPQLLTVPLLRQPPKLDGHLEDGEWAGAASLPALIDSGEPGRSFDYPRQHVYFGHDARNLYVAMRSHFPPDAAILKAPPRRSLAEPDVEVWGSESFELWLAKPGEALPYRFAGSPGGGFAEMVAKDPAWNGQWTCRTSMGTTEFRTEYWDVEVAVPFATLGLAAPEGAELGMNFARTWRCLGRLGPATSWAGTPDYASGTRLGRIRLSPSAPALAVDYAGSPALGEVELGFTLRNGAKTPYRGRLEVGLLAELEENDRQVTSQGLALGPGESRDLRVTVRVDDPRFQRLRYTLTPEGAAEPQVRYSVPFALRADFLDIVPLCLQDKLVVKPAHTLLRARLKSQGRDAARILVRVLDPARRPIAEREVTRDGDVWIDLPPKGPPGQYRVSLLAAGPQGEALERSEREFHRPETPAWMAERDDSMDRVLPPFTPLATEERGEALVLACWGREYRYRGGLLPASIRTGGLDDILAGPIVLAADGEALAPGSLTVTKRSAVRAELSAAARSPRLAATSSLWIEYDGLVYNTVELHAAANVEKVELRIPLKRPHARYAHLTGGVMSLGGGATRAVDASFASGFWPVVWLGDFERGLCWFAEGAMDLATQAAEPIAVDVGDTAATLTIRLADRLAAGQRATVRFGLLATPVKPLHPRYPLNIFADAHFGTAFDQPPRRRPDSRLAWTFHQWFLDIPILDPATKTLVRPDAALARANREAAPTKVVPYLDPYTLSSEYPEANDYLREWEMLPARHQRGLARPLPEGGSRPFAELWMSPQAESYRRFFAHKVADLVRRTGVQGLYFDFGPALRDSNPYHGGKGAYCILAMRDLYRRVANELVKAGADDYVIVVHNSKSVQIPGLTFATHFFNGEHHRAKSSATLHEGRDYLDTLPLYYFGIEHSGLPWGIHGNMLPELPEAESLIAELGVEGETVAEYLWKRTSSLVMPTLLHNCLPAALRLDRFYYKAVYDALADFDVPTATFHPYWRNGDAVGVDHPAVKVSFYTRPEAPRALLVVGNLGREAAEVTVQLDFERLHDWRRAAGPMGRVARRGEVLRAVERIGARDARILETGPHHVKLWVRRHGLALVEVTGHQRAR